MEKYAVIVFCALSTIAPQCAVGQDYPAKTIRLVVPSSPGGMSDFLGRILAQKLSEAFGRQMVVDNRAGASTIIGMAVVAKSPPDGYTLGITPASLAINPSMFKKLPYDTMRDFATISRIVEGPSMLLIHPSVAARNVEQLIAIAKSKPGSLLIGSPGTGTIPHLAAELFNIMARVDMPQVVYKGGTGQGMISVIGGETAVMYASPILVMPQIKAGKLRPLGVSTKNRSQALPDIPAIAETLPGYEATQWFAVVAPAGTPAAVIDRLYKEMARVLRTPEMKEHFTADGLEVVASTPEELASYLKSETEKWAGVIKTAGIKPE